MKYNGILGIKLVKTKIVWKIESLSRFSIFTYLGYKISYGFDRDF